MAEPVKARRLTDEEGHKPQGLVRRGEGKGKASVVRYRRGLVVLSSAGGNTVPVIARLVQTSEDRVREVVHKFNKMGMACLGPRWAGGRPRRTTTDDEAFIVETAKTRPGKLGRPFTRWSTRKLAAYLGKNPVRQVMTGRERLRELLAHHDVTFQRTKTWKERNDPDKDTKLDCIDEVRTKFADRVFAFHEFGPLALHPIGGCCWAKKKKPQRNRANYHKHCGVRQFHGCYSYGDDTIWGVVRERKSVANSLAAIKSCRDRRPDRLPIYVILDNLSPPISPTKSRPGAQRTTSSCASRPPTAPGPTPSSRTSGRYVSSCSTTPTTPTTPRSPTGCTPTWPGATSTPGNYRLPLRGGTHSHRSDAGRLTAAIHLRSVAM
jgi:transposase